MKDKDFSFPEGSFVFQAGSRRDASAVARLVELVDDANGRTEERDWALAWALGRAGKGNQAAAGALDTIARRTGEAWVRRMTLDARREVLEGDALESFIADKLEALPVEITNELRKDRAGVHLADLLEKQERFRQHLHRLYLSDHPAVVPAMVSLVTRMPFTGTWWQGLRPVLKAAEYREDGMVYGAFARRFAVTLASNLDGGPNSAYSVPTRTYLRRRAWRTLRRLGERGDAAYVEMAKEVLLAMSDKDLHGTPKNAYSSSRTEFPYVQVEDDAYAFNFVLFGTELEAIKPGTATWRSLVRRKRTSWLDGEQRWELYPQLWDARPRAVFELLATSNAKVVHTFAARVLSGREDLLQFVDDELLGKILGAPFVETVALGMEILLTDESAFGKGAQKAAAKAARMLIEQPSERMRSLAMRWIKSNTDEVLSDAKLLTSLLLSTYEDVRDWASELVRGATIDLDTQNELAQGIVDNLAKLGEADPGMLESVQGVLVGALTRGLSGLRFTSVIGLVQHADAGLTALGFVLLDHINVLTLRSQSDALYELAAGPVARVRQGVRPTLSRLAERDAAWARGFAARLMERFQDMSLGGPAYDIRFSPPAIFGSDTSKLNQYTLQRVRQVGERGGLIDISSGHRQIMGPNSDDYTSSDNAIGFVFDFAGHGYGNYEVDSNGWLKFRGSWAGSSYRNAGGYEYNNAVALFPWWADQETSHDGYVRAKTFGDAGSRVHVVEWRNYTHYAHSNSDYRIVTFQVCLYEGTNVIEFRYGPMEVHGNPSSQNGKSCGVKVDTNGGVDGAVRDFFGVHGTPPGSAAPFRTDLTTYGEEPHYPGANPNCGLRESGQQQSTAELHELFMDICDTLSEVFEETLRTLDLELIETLLGHQMEPVQLLAARAARVHETPVHELPTKVLELLVRSEFTSVRRVGVEILQELDNDALLEHRELLFELFLDADPELSEVINPLVSRLAEVDSGFGLELIDRLVARDTDEVAPTILQLAETLGQAIVAEEGLGRAQRMLGSKHSQVQLAAVHLVSGAGPWTELPDALLEVAMRSEFVDVHKAGVELLQGLPEAQWLETHKELIFVMCVDGLRGVRVALKKVVSQIAKTNPEVALELTENLLNGGQETALEALEAITRGLDVAQWAARTDLLKSGCTFPSEAVQELFYPLVLGLAEADPDAAYALGLELLDRTGHGDEPGSGDTSAVFFGDLLTAFTEAYLVERPLLVAKMYAHGRDSVYEVARDRVRDLMGATPEATVMLTEKIVERLVFKEAYEGAHTDLRLRLREDLDEQLKSVTKRMIFRLIYAKTFDTQELGVELLNQNLAPEDVSIEQMARLGDHALIDAREACWRLYEASVPRVKGELSDALTILEAEWEDTRQFAFRFADERLDGDDLTAEVLVSVVDSVRLDVQAFGKQMIEKFFGPADGVTYVVKLSQHPAPNVERFVTQYLDAHAGGDIERLGTLKPYFKRVLGRVNRGRVAKDEVLRFLEAQAMESREAAELVADVLTFASATVAIGDKARMAEILLTVQRAYPGVTVPIEVVPVEVRQGKRRRTSDAV